MFPVVLTRKPKSDFPCDVITGELAPTEAASRFADEEHRKQVYLLYFYIINFHLFLLLNFVP